MKHSRTHRYTRTLPTHIRRHKDLYPYRYTDTWHSNGETETNCWLFGGAGKKTFALRRNEILGCNFVFEKHLRTMWAGLGSAAPLLFL